MNSIKNIVTKTILAGLMSITAAGVSQAGAPALKWTMKPLAALSFDIGTKHAVSYFLSEAGQCKLTVVIANAMQGDVVPTDVPVRFDVAVDAGKDARLDTAEGKRLQFACAPGSQAMIVNEVEQVATYSAAIE
jgi:hypothetical protein